MSEQDTGSVGAGAVDTGAVAVGKSVSGETCLEAGGTELAHPLKTNTAMAMAM